MPNDEDSRYMASEWAFYRRTQQDIASEFGFKAASPVCNRIAIFLAETARPDVRADRWTHPAPDVRGEGRRKLAVELLGDPSPRRER